MCSSPARRLLLGLTGALELNNRRGKVEAFCEDSGRYTVCVVNEPTLKSLKPENCRSCGHWLRTAGFDTRSRGSGTSYRSSQQMDGGAMKLRLIEHACGCFTVRGGGGGSGGDGGGGRGGGQPKPSMKRKGKRKGRKEEREEDTG